MYILIIYINVPEFLFRQLEEGRGEYDIVQSNRKLLMEEAHCRAEFIKSSHAGSICHQKKKDDHENMRARKAAVISARIPTPASG